MTIPASGDLDPGRVRARYDKVLEMLGRDDFRSAEVKKLADRDLYRAKLDDSNRLLFRIARYNGERYALLLEVIENHAYEKSRFLRGAQVDESKLLPIEPHAPPEAELPALAYVNPANPRFNLLDKVLSFDEAQEALYRLPPPIAIIGSAGSGKTALTLEKLKHVEGDLLYVTRSGFLSKHARDLYFANGWENEQQNVDFLAFRELLESIRVPPGRELDFRSFRDWLARQPRVRPNLAHKLFEEFKGVLTGLPVDEPWLSREEYAALGVKRSIFLEDERAAVYELFERFLAWLRESGRYDSNIVAQQYLAEAKPRYDFAVVDEVQDLTNVQLALILRLLRRPDQFLLCGDSNQIVHPNFFSWAQLKTLFFSTESLDPRALIHVLRSNYRNAASVTELANRLLRLKQRRFGSIDHESNYLVETASAEKGAVEFLADEPKVLGELDRDTRQSTRFAVLVLREDLKAAARVHFRTPLIFSVQEAKGLEYDNIILYNFVSSERHSFAAIAEGLSAAEVASGELNYSRAADKTDKSLEAYKFFINALYVAVTRAVKNVYVIESDTRHELLQLLGLEQTRERLELGEQKSSLEEWQYEAHRLEQQGKLEQAEEVRRTVLHTQAVPWPVFDVPALADLAGRALDPSSISNKPRQQLYEYAVFNDDPVWVSRLAQLRFEPARGVLAIMEERRTRLAVTGANLVKRAGFPQPVQPYPDHDRRRARQRRAGGRASGSGRGRGPFRQPRPARFPSRAVAGIPRSGIRRRAIRRSLPPACSAGGGPHGERALGEAGRASDRVFPVQRHAGVDAATAQLPEVVAGRLECRGLREAGPGVPRKRSARATQAQGVPLRGAREKRDLARLCLQPQAVRAHFARVLRVESSAVLANPGRVDTDLRPSQSAATRPPPGPPGADRRTRCVQSPVRTRQRGGDRRGIGRRRFGPVAGPAFLAGTRLVTRV